MLARWFEPQNFRYTTENFRGIYFSGNGPLISFLIVKTRYNDLSYNDILRLQRYSFGPKRFCKASNDILFITNIVSIYSPKV
jgi:hypothetical protein